MEKQLLISLVSDQTIPNVQIIKEFGDSKTDYKFLLTKGMQRKGIVQWIVDATQIKAFQDIFVDEYSVADIENDRDRGANNPAERICIAYTGKAHHRNHDISQSYTQSQICERGNHKRTHGAAAAQSAVAAILDADERVERSDNEKILNADTDNRAIGAAAEEQL